MAIDIASPGANEAALEAALVQRLPPGRVPMRSGRSYGAMNVTLAAQTTSFGWGYIFGYPLLIPNPITISSLSVYVSIAANATTHKARVGIAVDNNGIPSQTLLAEGTTEIDLTLAPSTRTVTLTGAAVVPGWHWLLILMSEPTGGAAVAAQMHCIDTAMQMETGFHIGALDASAVLNTGLNSVSPVLATPTGGIYTDYASLQAALTALGPVNDGNTAGTYFPAIALTVA